MKSFQIFISTIKSFCSSLKKYSSIPILYFFFHVGIFILPFPFSFSIDAGIFILSTMKYYWFFALLAFSFSFFFYRCIILWYLFLCLTSVCPFFVFWCKYNIEFWVDFSFLLFWVYVFSLFSLFSLFYHCIVWFLFWSLLQFFEG